MYVMPCFVIGSVTIAGESLTEFDGIRLESVVNVGSNASSAPGLSDISR